MTSLEKQTSLPGALEVFDTFKTQDEDKDSDEESFHLQLDDEESEKSADKEKNIHSDETEDEILNKFETNGLPEDADHLKEVSLNANEENLLEKKTEENQTSSEEGKNEEKTLKSTEEEKNEKPGNDKPESNQENEKVSENKEEDIMDQNKEPSAEQNSKQNSEQDSDQNLEQNSEQIINDNTAADMKTEKSEPDVIKASLENVEVTGDVNVETKHIDIVDNDTEADIKDINNKSAGDGDDNVKNSCNQDQTVANDSCQEATETEVVNDCDKIAEDLPVSEAKEDTTIEMGNVESQIMKTVNDEKFEDKNVKTSENDDKAESTEDLFDISKIRDVEEDNASAIAEIGSDNHSSEKSDNDEQDNDENSDKIESELEQEESSLVDKEENMDFEEEVVSTLDEEKSEENLKDDEENDKIEENLNSVASEKDKSLSEEMEVVDAVIDPIEIPLSKSTKRSLSVASCEPTPTSKKMRLSIDVVPPIDQPKLDQPTEKPDKTEPKTLNLFEDFMKSKKFPRKLTVSDLEQFCLQKICEAIVHKSEVGELHQTIKKQELIIDNLRRDMQQLIKQTRDLDIVNKKLLNELKSQNGNQKPLVPLKITRSVGLQVKLTVGQDVLFKRKQTASPLKTPVKSPTPVVNNRVKAVASSPAVQSVVRQSLPNILQSGKSLLSQALQPPAAPASTTTPRQSPASKRTPIRPKLTPEQPKQAPTPGVIDLTDEDEKVSKGGKSQPISKSASPAAQARNGQSKTLTMTTLKGSPGSQNKVANARTVTTLSQGVRLAHAQLKNGTTTIPASVVTSASGGGPQLMYVLQPATSTSGNQKAVLLNFQPTNGVITSTLNGSTVSMIPKATNTVQLKTIQTSRKHPAPLPSLPPIPAPVNTSLKPLLPKPHLSIRKTDTGIILQWRMPYNLDMYESIASYQLFAYQETNAPPSTEMWRKVGDVKALALPMACTLTQFADKNKYYFAVRSVDAHKRIGSFSDPEEISL